MLNHVYETIKDGPPVKNATAAGDGDGTNGLGHADEDEGDGALGDADD
jgi:hypothetical protein